MKWSLLALVIGFIMDLIIGDPHSIPHPVALIGRMISLAEKYARRIFSKTATGEKLAGACIWVVVAGLSFAVPMAILWLCALISPWVRLIAESIMCWQIFAVKSLRDESMKVYYALKAGSLPASRQAVSMIVGRDTQRLDAAGVARAAVETVAENTSDGIIAPLLFMAIGGAPLGFFYKAANTMDSMLGYVEMPYKNIGMIAARADDLLNFVPARLSALIMLLAGWILKLDIRNGWKIFCRDRYNHASPNSAQTESVCAGLLDLQLAGDAWYHGVLHKKKFIGDPIRNIEYDDIPRVCRLMYVTSFIAVIVCVVIKAIICL